MNGVSVFSGGGDLYWPFPDPQKSVLWFLFPDCLTIYLWKSFTVCVFKYICMIWSHFWDWFDQFCSTFRIGQISAVKQSNIFVQLSNSVSCLMNCFPNMDACNSDVRMLQWERALDRLRGERFAWAVETNISRDRKNTGSQIHQQRK